MTTLDELQERCAFLERELGEVGIQLDAAQKRLRLAGAVVEAARVSNNAWYGSLGMRTNLGAAIAAWDAVPGDEGTITARAVARTKEQP